MKIEMQCACCGNYAGRQNQHWNRDRGYSACGQCYLDVWRKEGIDAALNQYGIPGYNVKKPDFACIGVSLRDAYKIGEYAKKQGLDDTANPFKVPGITQRGLYAWDAFNAGVTGESYESFIDSKLPLTGGEA